MLNDVHYKTFQGICSMYVNREKCGVQASFMKKQKLTPSCMVLKFLHKRFNPKIPKLK